MMPLPPCTSIASFATWRPHLGDVVLQHRRRHRRLLAAVDRAGGDRARRVHDVGVAGHAREHRFDALELADRQVELPADARVRARGDTRRPCAPPVAFDGSEMQRPTDSCSTSMRQPWPAIFGPPMMQSSGTNTSLPEIGPFWNGTLSGKWRRPIVDAGRVARDQRAGDAVVRRSSPSRWSGS